MRPARAGGPRLVVLLGIAVIAVVFAVLLSHRAPRRSGTDMTPNGAFVAALGRSEQTCQSGELLPSDTSAMQVTIGTYGRPGPPVSVAVTGPRTETLTSGGLPAGWRQGVVRIPVAHVSRAVEDARVCLRNDGGVPIAVAGDFPDPGYTMQVAGRTVTGGRLRWDYMRPGSESWFELLPALVYRSTLGKAGLIRGWAWIGALMLMLSAIALATRTVVREEERPQ
jgi:hypothetical protein